MTSITAGFALGLSIACGGAKTDRPVVTKTDQGDRSTSPSGQAEAKQGKSLVRLVNAIPSKNAIDVTGADQTLFSSVDYKTVTPYRTVRDNLVTFRLRGAGIDSVIADNHETLMDGNRYTIVALPNRSGGASLRIMRDEVVPDSGKARIRVINAAPNIGEIDVALQGQKEALFQGVNYASEAGYKDITPTTASLDIRSETRAKRPGKLTSMRFEAGKAYTIVLTGWGNYGVEAITFDDTPTGSTLSLTTFR
jgi:hypothetical protein